jgi:uncharacterized protein YbaR (Trm112 family)
MEIIDVLHCPICKSKVFTDWHEGQGDTIYYICSNDECRARVHLSRKRRDILYCKRFYDRMGRLV